TEPPRRRHVEPVACLGPSLTDLLDDGGGYDENTENDCGPMIKGVGPQLGQESAADLAEATREGGDRLSVQQILGGSAEHQHPGQGDDEGRNSDVGDPEALPRTDSRPQ